jgi:hypothetical protein
MKHVPSPAEFVDGWILGDEGAIPLSDKVHVYGGTVGGDLRIMAAHRSLVVTFQVIEDWRGDRFAMRAEIRKACQEIGAARLNHMIGLMGRGADALIALEGAE